MTNLERLKEQVASLFEKATDKEMIASLSLLNDTIDSVAADYTKAEEDNKELLDSYKDLVKHTSFKDDASKAPTHGPAEAPKIENFLRGEN